MRKFFKQTSYLFHLSAFIIIAAIILAACQSSTGNGGPGAMPPPQLPVITVTSQSATTYQEYPASLEGSRDIEIRPQVDGYLDRIYVDEGAHVKKGQLLFKVNARPYIEQLNNANAMYAAAKASLENAEINVNKLQPLVQNNVISDVQLKSAQAAYNAAKANVAQAAAAVQSARINVGYTSITAPANGYVGKIPLKTGSLARESADDPLTVISETKDIRAYFSMSEVAFLQFKDLFPGKTFEQKIKQMPPVELILASDSAYPEKGKVELAEGQFNKTTGAINFRATFPNAQGTLRSGNTGKIRIARKLNNAIIVPQESTFELQDKIFVYTVADSNKIVTKPITVSGKSANYYYVSNGVSPGEKIVLSSQSTLMMGGLRDGMPITPQMVSTDSLLRAKPL